jgi:hypothetical protein
VSGEREHPADVPLDGEKPESERSEQTARRSDAHGAEPLGVQSPGAPRTARPTLPFFAEDYDGVFCPGGVERAR